MLSQYSPLIRQFLVVLFPLLLLLSQFSPEPKNGSYLRCEHHLRLYQSAGIEIRYLSSASYNKINLGLALEEEEVQLLNCLDRDSMLQLIANIKSDFEAKVEKNLNYCIHKQPINSDVETAFLINGVVPLMCKPWQENHSSDKYYFVDTYEKLIFDPFYWWKKRPKSSSIYISGI